MIRDIGAADFDWVYALNQLHAKELSALTEARMAELLDRAVYARQAEGGAFMIGFDQATDYDSATYLWLRARYERFFYVDRIAVAATHRRRGLARALYKDAFAAAARGGYPVVTCEVNSDPPNPASDAFHASLGFGVVGEEALPDRGKSVRYMARPV